MNPRTQLNAIARIAHDLATRWDDYETTSHDLATDHGSERLGVHGGAISDPTYADRIANVALDETKAKIALAYLAIYAVEERIAKKAADNPETARLIDAEKRGARCSQPACDDLAVKDGLCSPDWWAKRNSGPGAA